MNENLLVLLAVVAFSFLFYSVPIYFLYKWEKKHENDPIDGYTIITRIVCVALALFYQHLKSNGLYFGILINGFIYITLGYFIVFYRHKPKTINKEKPIKKPKKQKENKISKTQYFLAIIYIFYEWAVKKLQKPYQFAKLHFIEICLALIALALLKIAF